MIDQTLLQLLRECRQLLHRPGLWFVQNYAMVRRIDSYLAAERALPKFGSSVIAHARVTATTIPNLTIDADEDDVRGHPEGIQIRAWLLVPHEMIALLNATDPAIEIAFAKLDWRAREVLILGIRHGVPVAEIALQLGMPRWRVRRHLRRGIDALGRAIDRASE